jgi:pectate lyase
MKLSLLALNLLALSVFAAPTPTSEDNAAPAEIAKRATLTDSASGYASQNGGTTGGKGGTTTTVSTYAQFTAAVAGDGRSLGQLTGFPS